MDVKNALLIAAFLLVLVSIMETISLNRDLLSTYATRSGNVTLVKLLPSDEVKVGETLLVTLYPGKDGVYTYVTIHKSNGILMRRSLKFCGQFKCLNIVSQSFPIRPDFTPGSYYVQVYDYGTGSYATGKYIKENFNVIR